MMLMGPFQHEMSYDTMATSLSRHLTAQEKGCLVPVFFSGWSWHNSWDLSMVMHLSDR